MITNQKIKLRDYQSALIQGIFENWKTYQKVMAQLPTGGGKTVIFAAIAGEFVTRGEKILVLAHREELIAQAANKLEEITGSPVGIIKAGFPLSPLYPVQVASVQSMVNRLRDWPDFGLIIVDEAHHSTAETYRKILRAYPSAYQLGVTATPIRADGTGFSDLFDALVTGPTLSELIKAGHLSRFRLFAAKAMKTQGVKSIAGDYSPAGLARVNSILELSGDLVESYRQHSPDRRCLVFAINVEHSQAIAARYRAEGIPALHLDGETPEDERREALAAFAEGKIKVISNCALFGEGLDIPALEAVQVAKPTKSLSLWLQMVGRALRPAPGKEHAIIIDHTDNWDKHGLPTRPRRWTLEKVEQEEESLEKREDGSVQASPPKPKSPQIVEVSADLVEITEAEEAALMLASWRRWWNEINDIQHDRGYKPGWTYYQVVEGGAPLEIWQALAEKLGRSLSWAESRFQEQEEAGQTQLFPPPLPAYAR